MPERPDPFAAALREFDVPLAPRNEFARALRSRLVAELGPQPEETTMPALAVREYTPARLHSLTPYLSCKDAMRAIEWYQEVFDAAIVMAPIIMDDGHVGHCEMRVGDTVFMIADEYPPEGVFGPETLGGNSVSLMMYVPDSEATFRRALERGAAEVRPIGVAHGARGGVLRDPWGHRWFVQTEVEPQDVPVEDAPSRRYGDVGYMVLRAPDGARAARFYGELFGWQTAPGYRDGAFHIDSITPPAGIDTGDDASSVRLYFRVDDIETAAARVRELGGQVLSTNVYESGGDAECVDDQGMRFNLFRPKPGY